MNALQPGSIESSKENGALRSQLELSEKQVAEKICSVVKRAEEIYAQAQHHKVILDKQIQVTLPRGRARGRICCQFCDHITIAPGDFKIKNIRTQAAITFDSHTLHQLQEHAYFGFNQHKVDSIKAGQILGLEPASLRQSNN